MSGPRHASTTSSIGDMSMAVSKTDTSSTDGPALLGQRRRSLHLSRSTRQRRRTLNAACFSFGSGRVVGEITATLAGLRKCREKVRRG